MIPDAAENAVLASACLGMLAGILLMEYVVPLGTYPTAVAVFVAATIATGVGIRLLPHAETIVASWGDREVLEDGDPS